MIYYNNFWPNFTCVFLLAFESYLPSLQLGDIKQFSNLVDESNDITIMAAHWPKYILLYERLEQLKTVWTDVALETEKKALRFKLLLPCPLLDPCFSGQFPYKNRFKKKEKVQYTIWEKSVTGSAD